MLSRSCKYAIRAVLYLAKNPTEKLGSKQIAESLDIPAPFLAKTMQKLSRKKIISSVKGPNGGFYLSENDKTSTLIDVIDCIDGLHNFENCFLGRTECSSANPCIIHHIYAPFKNKLLGSLKLKTIIEIANEGINHDSDLSILLKNKGPNLR